MNGPCLMKSTINSVFKDKEPWQIVAVTTSTVLFTVWLWDILNQDEGIYSRTKKKLFKLVRYIPAVRRKIEAETEKIRQNFEHDVSKHSKNLPFILNLPELGLEKEQLLKKVDDYLSLGSYKWKEGAVSGAVYYYNPVLVDLVKEVYAKASYTNPLHPDIFPGVCKMEAEVIRMTGKLFRGGKGTCGTMTTGGTESIMMAVKAYRDYGREIKGITKPNMVAPRTAHTAFDKAGQYLGVYVRVAKIDPKTTEVDVKDMEKRINKNTVMLVGSAPNFPYGTIDNIEAIAALGRKYNIPVHVDSCLGGFLTIFMKRAGYNVRPYDFSVPGVTSISADTHKYGFAPKGSSVILYSDPKYRHHQYTVTTEWPGGVYGSPTVNGSRNGGVIAATWATLLSFGLDGYIEATKSIIDTARYIEIRLRKMKGIFIFGTPATSVIALGSKDFEIYRLSTALSSLGWSMNTLQFPSGIHICVTYMHTQNGVADRFLKDVETSLAELMKSPEKPIEGTMAVYGAAQDVPDRALIGEFTWCFLDAMFYTPDD